MSPDSDNSTTVLWVSPEKLIRVLTTVCVPLVFSIIVIVGVIGNTLVILVVTTNRQMRNTTNALILNLALADLLFIVLCVPFTATDYSLDRWPFGLVWCQAVQYLIYVTSYVSIYTLIFMSFDRFLAVVFPVSSLPYRTVTNAFGATFVLWVIISSAAVPIWFAHHLRPKHFNTSDTSENSTEDDSATSESPWTVIELTPVDSSKEGVSTQTMSNLSLDNTLSSEDLSSDNSSGLRDLSVMSLWESDDDVEHWCRFSSEDYSHSGFSVAFFVSGYAIPLLLIVIMYIYMLRRLWHPVGDHQISHESLRNKRRVTKLVLVVIVVFAVCWAPIQMVLLLKAVKLYPTRGPEDFPRIIFQILSHVLAYLNSCVNPILYAFLSDNFRKAFHQLLPSCCHRGGPHNRSRLHYELTTLKHQPNGDGGSSNGETRRYGKRGKLVKHASLISRTSQHPNINGTAISHIQQRQRIIMQQQQHQKKLQFQRRSQSLAATTLSSRELEAMANLHRTCQDDGDVLQLRAPLKTATSITGNSKAVSEGNILDSDGDRNGGNVVATTAVSVDDIVTTKTEGGVLCTEL